MRVRQFLDQQAFVLKETVQSFGRNRGFSKAATLTYYGVFSLFPLLLLVLFLVGRFIVSSQSLLDGLDRTLTQMFPMFKDSIRGEIYGLAGQRTWGLLSVLLLFWSVTPLASSLRDTLADIFRASRAISFLRARVFDALAVLGMLLLLFVMAAAEMALPILESALAGRESAARMTEFAVPFLMTWGVVLLVYVAFIPARVHVVHLAVGSVVASALLSAMRPLLTILLQFNPDYGYMFGSLKAVFLLLVWVNYGFAAILLGAELMATLGRKEALFVRGLMAGVGPRDRFVRRLARYAVRLQPGDVLFREGDAGNEMYYVVAGSVEMRRGERVVRAMREGEYFGEMALFLGARRTATAAAAAPDTEVIRVAYANLETVFREDPQILLSLLRELSQRLDAANVQVDELSRPVAPGPTAAAPVAPAPSATRPPSGPP
jgi:membrane protein